MIVKTHEIPIPLLQLAGLKKRVETTHPQFPVIADDHTIHQSGYRGELAFDYYLRAIDDEETAILNGLRVVGSNPFQMDNLILNPYFFTLAEVKNFSGTIEFDHEFGQMTQHSNGRTRSFKDPINQVDTQIFHLQNWLMQHGYSAIPIVALVIFVSNNVHLSRADSHAVDPRIIRPGKFIEKYQELKQKFTTRVLSDQQLINLSRFLKKHHRPLRLDVLKKYHLTAKDIRPGAPCPECYYLPAVRLHGRWSCPSCQWVGKDAHHLAFKDFQLLYKDTITNREARWLLQVDDIQVVSKLLKSAEFQATGSRKGRVYHLNYDFQKDYNHLVKIR
ncbi:nuclease-related domain-containing protein [Piscibacillus sp. B03]|uniref:nuclease-related domain-containing protein n=1 Tax=Piscibacillus sp. B03 TaxID=3457430 RepID=UPI003FCE22C0